MKAEIREVLFNSVDKYNIIPLTSKCNVNCLFCSHKQNPPGIQSYAVSQLSWHDIEDIMIFLSPDKKIILGESATRIMEGEPLTHPQFYKILCTIRERFPQTPLQITTNGTLLTNDLCQKLKALEPLELNLSLNSAIVQNRAYIMKDDLAENAIKAAQMLAKNNISYHGSIVPLPLMVGWHDLENTVSYLQDNGALSVRIFLPGITRYRKNMKEIGITDVKGFMDWEVNLYEYVCQCRRRYHIPITIEPAGLKDLLPEVAGVIKNSKAEKSGIKTGMRILSIDGKIPFSRVDAFNALADSGEHSIKVCSQDGVESSVTLYIKDKERSGIVMDYDLPSWQIENLERSARNYQPNEILVLTSEWGAPLLCEGLRKRGFSSLAQRVRSTYNHTFGGNIRCAGLLLVKDFAQKLDEEIKKGEKPHLVLLPQIAFDHRGRDLTGQYYADMNRELNVSVNIV